MEPNRHPPVFGVTAPGTDFRIDHAQGPTVEQAASFVFVHEVRVERLGDGSYRPCCSCGWSTTVYPSDDPHIAPVWRQKTTASSTLWRSVMAGPSFPEPSGVEIVGEAVVGSGQYLAFIPCHKQPVRLTQAEVAPRNTVDCPKDGRRWDVSFVKQGVDWVAVWVLRT